MRSTALEVLPHDPARRRADRDVVLLLHGTGGSKDDWRFPQWRGHHYDHDHPPADVRTDNQLTPPIPLVADVMPFDLSDLRTDVRCWSGVLAALGHTVINYSQRGKDDEIRGAQTQFEQRIVPFIRDEVLTGPLSGKRVVVLAHSRGGILIRAYLHGFPADGQQWIDRVITLCSPHHGTFAPTARDRLGDLLDVIPGGLLVHNGLQFFFGIFSETDSHLELLPGNPLFDRLADPADVPAIRFQTMGGTSIRWSRLYFRVFAPDSYVPNLLDFRDIRFDWRQVAVEIPIVSPVLDSLDPLLELDEIRQGAGDIAVADDRARLPDAAHRTFPVNHAEALWDEALFAWVADELGTPLSQLAGDVDCGRPTGGLRFEPPTVVFNQVRAGDERTHTVQATNGTAEPVRLSFAAARTDLPFQWDALDITLPSGETTDFEVRYKAPDDQDRTDDLRVTSSLSTRPLRQSSPRSIHLEMIQR